MGVLRISIDRKVLAAALASGEVAYPICIEFPGNDCAVYAREVLIPGESRVVYRPKEHDPGDPTASVWIEVDGDVTCR